MCGIVVSSYMYKVSMHTYELTGQFIARRFIVKIIAFIVKIIAFIAT